MAPRATWTGHLKISLINIPVKLYTAVSTSSSRVKLNMLHGDCLQRVKQFYQCPEHGPVERSDIVKGYEFEKGKYLEIDDSTLKNIRLETTKIIEIVSFVNKSQIDPIYFNSHYYMAPDAVGEEAYRVFKETLDRNEKIAIGRVVMSGREHTVRIAPKDKGLSLTTLHFAKEVRKTDAYFEDIKTSEVPKEQVDMFSQLINGMAAEVDPTNLVDRYEEALVEVIKAKIEGREPEVQVETEAAKTVDFMEALRASVAAENIPKKPAAEAEADKDSKTG
ncbi:MAG: Ku protein [Gammaproteobacteria bacterium]|nr:Ku protein [Gammaproteobacteria bacterium]MDH5801470.1 Ku protein [Gammaproteobacteria bacterium]